jgi:hypothetical protein
VSPGSGSPDASSGVSISGRVGSVRDIIGGNSVRIDGDRNTVTISSAETSLTLDQLHLYKLYDVPRKETDFLLTNLRATDCVGRTSDIAALVAWLDEPQQISVRCLTGSAGAGKTRLAIELCDEASKFHKGMEWLAGFATSRELQRFQRFANLAGWFWPQPTLVVVDDAAAAVHVLRAWLLELARRRPDPHGPKLRLLLLERDATAEFGWWRELISPAGLSTRSPADLMSPRTPVELPRLASLEDRRALLSDVMEAVGKFRQVNPLPRLPPLGESPALDKRLSDEEADNEPLYLVMAGVASVIEGAPFAFSRGRNDLARYIAEVEAGRIAAISEDRGIDREFAFHLAACITLQGGCSLDEARNLLKEERGAVYRGAVSDEVILGMLAEVLPLTRSGEPAIDAGELLGLQAVRPDLVGEALLLNQIARPLRSMPDQLAIIERAWFRSPHGVHRTLFNTTIDFWRGDPKSPMAIWRAHLENRSTEDFKARLDTGELSPDAAVQEIWQIGLTMRQWLTLTQLVLPYLDKLSPQQLGVGSAARSRPCRNSKLSRWIKVCRRGARSPAVSCVVAVRASQCQRTLLVPSRPLH